MNLRNDVKVCQVDGALAVPVDGQLVALDPSNGICYGLNEMATKIWEMLAHPILAADICDFLVLKYEVGLDECMTDCCAIISQLIDAGLVRIV